MQIISIVLVCGCFKLYAVINLDRPSLKWSFLVKSLLIALVVLHYFLTKWNRKLSLHFSSFLSLLYIIDAVEELQHDRTSDELQIYSVIMALLGSLSVLSYCQRELFLAYSIGYVYTLARTYFIFPLNDAERGPITFWFSYIRSNVFIFMSLAVQYTFSRKYHQHEREQFKEKNNQQQLLSMFHNLLRMFHDGIILTTESNGSPTAGILYRNNRLEKIFDVQKQQNANNQSLSEQKSQKTIDEVKLILNMQTAQQYALEDEEGIGGSCQTMNDNIFDTLESMEYVPQFLEEHQEQQKKRANLW